MALRLIFHEELTPSQQQQAASLYWERWQDIIKREHPETGLNGVSYALSLARQRDEVFPYGQLILLDNRKVLGSLCSTLTSEAKIQEASRQPDAWNNLTDHGALSPETYQPEGDRWLCFALQSMGRQPEEWRSPGTVLLLAAQSLAFGTDVLPPDIGRSAEVLKQLYHPQHRVQYCNPLTRLSGFQTARRTFPRLLASDYATLLQHPEQPEYSHLPRKCALRYHLRHGAQLEQLIPDCRIHDQEALGWGASVLYQPTLDPFP